ncbi:phosphatidylinositol mannoside acyltransferase [Amycolatopsis sp. CA-230715]|uniref:phosphatidylinositol mannoside acyltransferase n=1 Tax=Amycolatopsis sp. CA-230715 TaxID=2745196 RepID=UPI001C03408B|nr:phosphatidylinositol mannoside acyltransferase [Amycolatopsis sp. CA-230715]QWF84197.1 Phosphatidylinositol mannoside acyltransferase [Amycolatopsis sp. CA-230715]
MSGLSERVADLSYAAGWRLSRFVPGAAFSLGADIAARRGGAGVQQLRRNLARVVPQADDTELDDLTRRAMRSYARYWHEAFRLPSMNLKKVADNVWQTVSGVENLDAALAEGNGAVLALAHTGNWDVAGVWLNSHSGRFTTVVERLKPESLYRRFVAYRESLGFEIMPLTGSSAAFRLLLQRLRENKVVCLLSDRDLTPGGLEVTFFGEQTKMAPGPARLAATTGAALIPVGCWYTEDGWQLRLHPRIRVNHRTEVPAATQALADVFAGDIAAHPTDWHMLQKFWLSDFADPEPARLGEAEGA